MVEPRSSAERIPAFPAGIAKCPTGIHGLDEITSGGLPRGRPTLVCGGAGCGKTLLGLEFLVRGATQFDEPGVCLSFEENVAELTANVASLGFDLHGLIAAKKLAIDYVHIERSLVEETGEYDLEALFLRIAHAADSVGARRVLVDSVETLFAGLDNESILRAELRRLFRWLKDRGLTAVITAERGTATLTRHGLEEYISDCVIVLDHRVNENVFTRRMRIVKYRGSEHGTNEYPFLIDHQGVSVLPITSASLDHAVSNDRMSTGIPALDDMLGGRGIYRGSTILISGSAGTGKSTVASRFAEAACERGERCLMYSFEESSHQVVRNMQSVGIDLGRWMEKGRLQFKAARPTAFGLEMHLVHVHKAVREFRPSVVVIDPITGLVQSGARGEARAMVLRLIDFLKSEGITAVMTSLTSSAHRQEQTEVNVSSLIDTWLMLRDIEAAGERNRGIHVLKARGLGHSNQIREFLLTSQGMELRDVYLGQAGVLTGSARVAQEERDRTEELLQRQNLQRAELAIAHRRKAVEAQIAALQADLAREEQQMRQQLAQEDLRNEAGRRMQHLRGGASDGYVRPSEVEQP